MDITTQVKTQVQLDRLAESWARPRPRSRRPPAPPLTFEKRRPVRRVRRPTLLVIEDSADHALLVSIAARRADPDLDVRFAANGREGIGYLAGWPPFHDRRAHPMPDLIVLDLVMPGMHGFEVLTWIRDRPQPLYVPVVVLTSSANPEDARTSLRLGALAAYRKPADLTALGDVVGGIVDRWIGRSAFSWALAT